MGEVIYSIVIPVKPEKDKIQGYNAGHFAGELEVHQEHIDRYDKVFWSWGLSKAGMKNEHKEKWVELSENIGNYCKINGVNVKIDTTGYFYSSATKSICCEFKIDSFKMKKEEIKKDEMQYIPPFRKENHYDVNWWKGNWMLINHLGYLKHPYSSQKIRNYYEFPDFPYSFYSNPNKSIVKFNTNHLTSGNAFVMKEV